jgi:hypothetical protein
VAGWEAFARHFDATQHVTGPIVVASQSDEVAADTHVRAYHQMKGVAGGDIWMVAGHYHVRLRSLAGAWKIAGLTLQVFYQEGNCRSRTSHVRGCAHESERAPTYPRSGTVRIGQ